MKLGPALLKAKAGDDAMLSLLKNFAGDTDTCAVEAPRRGQVTAGTGPVKFASIEETTCPWRLCTDSWPSAQQTQVQSLKKCRLSQSLAIAFGR